jgi:3-hydroxymyristoyl/3-hydroxydecanoyl-(acyl carrier protein) dehydratase
MVTVERFFPLDHPAAQGHFPGNPIIPGAVLLSETLRAIEASLDLSLAPGQLASAKFLSPTRPGDRVTIEFSDSARGTIRFACSVGPVTVLTGVVTCEAISTPA